MSYQTQKRIVDLVGGFFGVLLFSPLLLFLAVYIFMVSPGPVLADTPKRVGKNNRLFRMYKFRTMILNAHQYLLEHPDLYEEYKNNDYKLDNDPRWIPGAQVIRKFSLDEFPQFFNVLKGEMSLVGPRAYYPFELKSQQEVYPEASPYIKKLLQSKPGLTGPWQVGGRSELNFVERVKLDATYADNQSIWYDLQIIFKTPLAVISGKGAL